MKYKILQIKNISKCNYAFEDWDWAEKHGFNMDDYQVVYEGEIDDEYSDDIVILEKLFTKFNVQRPVDFHGHSLSVSDIIIIDEVVEIAYYCDDFGWKEI